MAILNINVPSDYTPSDGEVDNLVYLTCKYTIGWNMRACDLAIMKIMAGEMQGAEGISRLVENTCEFVWDHISGEPESFSGESLFEHMREPLEAWYAGTTPEERALTS